MNKATNEVTVSVRLRSDQSQALVRAAKMRGVSKSELLREFATKSEQIVKFLDEISQEADKLATWVVDNVPDHDQPELLEFLTTVMAQATEIKRRHPKRGRKK
jgi:uncharacterized protein (DUF1778 family)